MNITIPINTLAEAKIFTESLKERHSSAMNGLSRFSRLVLDSQLSPVLDGWELARRNEYREEARVLRIAYQRARHVQLVLEGKVPF